MILHEHKQHDFRFIKNDEMPFGYGFRGKAIRDQKGALIGAVNKL